jgi:hypothetical protein
MRSAFAATLKSAAFLSLFTTLVAAPAAQDRDGLNDQARASLYNAQTAMVLRLDASAVAPAVLKTTFEGMFDQEPLAVLRANQGQWEPFILGTFTSANDLFDKIGTAFDRPRYATVVALEQGGAFQAFAAVPIGKMDDRAFGLAANALKLVLDDVVAERRGELAIIRQPAGKLDAAPFDAAVQKSILDGLVQAPAGATVNVASPMSPLAKARVVQYATMIGAGAAELDFAKYVGGYVVTGPRPEFHFYAVFGTSDRAEAALKSYEAAWTALIKSAKQWDIDAAKPGAASIKSAITWTELVTRLQTGLGARVFGTAFQLDLDTTDLRIITGAAVDRYVRPVKE